MTAVQNPHAPPRSTTGPDALDGSLRGGGGNFGVVASPSIPTTTPRARTSQASIVMRHPWRRLVLLAAIVPAGLVAPPAQAEPLVFTGESLVDPANWNNSGNWRRPDGTRGHVPTAADDVLITRGQVSQAGPILSNGAGVARSIVLETALQVTGGATLTVGGGTSSFAGNLSVFGGGTLMLSGDATWSAGGWNIGGASGGRVGGTVENRGRLELAGNVSSGCPSPCGGVLRNAVGAAIDSRVGSPLLSTPFVNHGTLTVSAGELFLQGLADEPSNGLFAIAGGAVLQVGSAGLATAFRLGSGARVAGPGALRLQSGNFEFVNGIGPSGEYSVGTTQTASSDPGLGGGFLDLGGRSGSTARLVGGGSGGGVRDGELTVGAGESLLDRITFEDGATVSFDPQARIETGLVTVRGGATLILDGDVTWSGANLNIGGVDGGTIENRGRLMIAGGVLAGCPSPCGGVVRNRSGGTMQSRGTNTLHVPLVNEGLLVVESGTLATERVEQRAGEIAVAESATFGGPITTITIDGGTVSGAGTVRSSTVTNSAGTVSPGRPATSPGLLRIDGSYLQGSGGSLAVDIRGQAPATGHDRLAVAGPATLAGTLAIATGAGFDPPLDSTYDVVTAVERRGTFGSLTGAQLTAKRYRDEYEPTLARLRVVRAPIAPGGPGEPIILLPGFLGSRVECGGSEAWPHAPVARVLAMRLGPNGSDLQGPCSVPEGRAGLIEQIAGIDVYGSMLEFLERIAPGRVHVFGYDWRKSPAESLAALDRLVDRVRGGGKVVLLGHSMGGLVSRMYMDDPARAAKVARAVTLGTAYWGTPKALFPLAAGVESPLPSSLDVLIEPQDMQEFSRNLTGLYLAWPSARLGGWLTVAKRRPSPLDGPGVRGFVRVLDGNVRLYDRALAEHARALDEFDVNGVDYRVLLGTGKQTIGSVGIRPIGADLWGGGNLPGGAVVPQGIYRVGWVNGDETVPRRSAALGGSVPPDRLHIVCGIDHLELVQDEAVRDLIGDFLRAGEPIAGADDDCPARGVEFQLFTLPLGARRTRAAGGPPGSMTLEQADRAGAIELLDLGAQKLFATNASRPVELQLEGRRIGLRVTPLGDDGDRARPRFYGPLSGTIAIAAGAGAKIREGGKLVAPRRGADRRPPHTRARVRVHGRRAVLRLRATDRSGVAATFTSVGGRPAKRVRRILRVRRVDLNRVRFQSVDVFGNLERPRRVPTGR
jgi:lecithin:cholesterol acyltransferase